MTPHGHHGVLAAVARAFADRQIVVIGAVAMQWHFPSFRGTLDLDLCIAIDLDEHGRAVALPPPGSGWARHPTAGEPTTASSSTSCRQRTRCWPQGASAGRTAR